MRERDGREVVEVAPARGVVWFREKSVTAEG